VQLTWVAWGIFWLAAGAIAAYNPNLHPVNESYADGARNWRAQQPLYKGCGTGFIYPAQAAMLHLPYLALPHALYELAWRFTTIGLFAVGIHRLSKWSFDDPALTLFPLITLLTLPKAWTIALNGQTTIAMAGLMLLALHDVVSRHWYRAAAALLLALAFKPLAIVLVLLAAALYAPIRRPLVLGGAIFLAIPFTNGNPHYVWTQYVSFVVSSGAASDLGAQQMVWPQIFSLLNMFGATPSDVAQTVLKLIGALLTLYASLHACRRFPPRQAVLLIYSLAVCYLLLLNPRTENSSYTLVVPAVAAFAARALLVDRDRLRASLLIGIIIGLTGGFEITRTLTPQAPIVWPCPIACLVFLGYLVTEIAKPRRWDQAPVGQADRPVSGHIESRRAA
jgi:hypothetical protein